MNNLSLKELSLFLTEDIVVIGKEVKQRLLAEKMSKKHGFQTLEEEISPSSIGQHSSEDLIIKEPAEEYGEQTPSIQFEGEFLKGILIIYQGTGLEATTYTFLMNILNAVGCTLKDIALVSETSLLGHSEEGISQLGPQKIIVFGKVNHPIMKLKKENFVIINNPAECFFADELKEMEENIQLKKKLWTTLQLFFNIKNK